MPPFLTAPLAGTGGCLRRSVDDFQVEEIPLYEPAGEGPHAYLEIEKEGISTFEAIRRLARRLGRGEAEFGYAGLKDARARTVQRLSIEHPPMSLEELGRLDVEGIRVRWARWHRNKLRVGHLRGNRFQIRVADVGPRADEQARAVLSTLHRRGMPNYFGPQRFGVTGTTHLLGRALVRGSAEEFFELLVEGARAASEPHPIAEDGRMAAGTAAEHGATRDRQRLRQALAALPRSARWERRALEALDRCGGRAERALHRLDRRMLRFYVAAYQSALFNRILARRLDHLDRLEDGDVAMIHANGACFVVPEAEAEQDRLERFEISATGPIYGYRMLQAEGAPGRLERDLLAAEGVDLARFKARGLTAFKGARRPLRVPIGEPVAESDRRGLVVRFALPPGSYATVLLGEVMKRADGTGMASGVPEGD